MPLFAVGLLAALGLGGWAGASTDSALTHPASIPSAGNGSGINLTTVAGYAIAGGLAFYFGKKVFK